MTDFQDIHGREAGTWAVNDEQAHGREVRSMFARISGVYDFMNHLLSFNRDKAWRDHVVAGSIPTPGKCWTCAPAPAIWPWPAVAGARGASGSPRISAPRCSKAHAARPAPKPCFCRAADAMQLPFRDRKVDAVTVGFGVRNFADVRRGLGEIARVLRPGGQFMVLEFYRDDREATGEARGVPGPIRFGLNTVIPAGRKNRGPRQRRLQLPAQQHGRVPDTHRVRGAA